MQIQGVFSLAQNVRKNTQALLVARGCLWFFFIFLLYFVLAADRN
jgi:hypothetical protein